MGAERFFRLLSDYEYVDWLKEHTGNYSLGVLDFVSGFRVKAFRYGVADNVKIHAEIFPGATFKRDIPQMGPCCSNFKYIQDWHLPDPPTEHAGVSWIPTPLSESTDKNMFEQKAVVARFSSRAILPTWCQVSFGSAVYVAGMALAHQQATGIDPFNSLVVRTDTCRTDNNFRLNLFWNRDRGCLDCGDAPGDELRSSGLSVFAVGVVKATR